MLFYERASGSLVLQNGVSSALSYATSRGYQIHPDAFAMLKGLETDVLKMIQEIIKTKKQTKNSVIIVDDIKNLIDPRVAVDVAGQAEQVGTVLMDPTPKVNTAEGVDGYAALFRSRFEKSMRILAQRPDSKRIAKISSIKNNAPRHNEKSGRGNNSSLVIAGLLMSKRTTKKNGIELVVDDYTESLAATAAKQEARKQASALALDQMVMLEIESARGTPGWAVKSVFSPDIPDHIPARSRSEAYAVLISDLHVGSKYFMEAQFLKFLEWLAFDDEIVRKIKFVCVGGDLIDGIGIFPNQDKELLETDPAKQMGRALELLAKIPKQIRVFIIPGNHDPGRRALPQPALPAKLDNCAMLGNPALVELNGVKVLMYHGQGLDDVIATTPGLSYARPVEAMKVLLKARHLSPTYGGRTPLAPELEDMMVISEVPDILHCGHVHVVDVQNYRGTLMINSGAWQRQTKYQQTMGITPTPGIAVFVNLATLQPFKQDFNQ